MIIDIRKLKKGGQAKLDFSYDAFLHDYDHLGEKIFVNPIKISGYIENTGLYLQFFAFASTSIEVSCGRCLKKVDVLHELEIKNDLFFESPADEDYDDTFLITSNEVNIDDIVLPAIMLELAMNYICDYDCMGLCSKCGADLNVKTCSCDTRTIDPRLEVLKKLLD